MALPNVNIGFANGALGSVEASADGVVGMLATFAGTASLPVKTAVCVYKSDCLEQYGIASGTPLHKAISEFYAEAGEGAELWLYGVNENETDDLLAEGRAFLKAANGRIRTLAIVPATAVAAADVAATALAAQSLGEWAATELYAPVLVIMPAQFSADLPSLVTMAHNRVGILVGDTVSGSSTAMIGVLAGRIAKVPVQVHVGRVKDGALKIAQAFIGAVDPSKSDAVETLNTNGYITLRTFVGKSGYFFNDDNLATAASDDYRSLARRRVIDKAYRRTYAVLLERVNDNLEVTSEGKLTAGVAKDIETDIMSDIYTTMTAEGNLSVDPADSSDMGARAVVDTENDVVATNRVNATVQVKPYGYGKFISVLLGFLKQ